MENFTSKNKLDFETTTTPRIGSFLDFRVGTITGLWISISHCYVILSLINSSPGNGHFDDVLEWFENSCKRDDKNLLILKCMNVAFYRHLLLKRGFMHLDKERKNCIKVFNVQKFSDLLENGNEILIKGSLRCR